MIPQNNFEAAFAGSPRIDQMPSKSAAASISLVK
jgi:hypothetical protein